MASRDTRSAHDRVLHTPELQLAVAEWLDGTSLAQLALARRAWRVIAQDALYASPTPSSKDFIANLALLLRTLRGRPDLAARVRSFTTQAVVHGAGSTLTGFVHGRYHHRPYSTTVLAGLNEQVLELCSSIGSLTVREGSAPALGPLLRSVATSHPGLHTLALRCTHAFAKVPAFVPGLCLFTNLRHLTLDNLALPDPPLNPPLPPPTFQLTSLTLGPSPRAPSRGTVAWLLAASHATLQHYEQSTTYGLAPCDFSHPFALLHSYTALRHVALALTEHATWFGLQDVLALARLPQMRQLGLQLDHNWHETGGERRSSQWKGIMERMLARTDEETHAKVVLAG